MAPQGLLGETRRVYKELPVGLCYLDTDFRYIHINDWLAELNGISAEEHLGRTIGELIPDVAAGVEVQFRQVIDTGEPIVGGAVEAETPAQPGIKRYFQHSYYPVRSDDGEVIGISCVVEDVTARNEAVAALRKAHDELEERVQERTAELQRVNESLNQEIAQRVRAEEELGDRERYTRGITTNIADAVVTIDARGGIQSFNPAAESMFGYTVAHVLGKNVSILMPEPDHSMHDGYIQAYLETGKSKILGIGPREVTARRKDGSTFPIELTIGEMRLGDGPVFIGAMRDITERKQAENKLRESEASFSAVVNNSPLAIMVKDTEGRCMMTNTQFTNFLELPTRRPKGRPFLIYTLRN